MLLFLFFNDTATTEIYTLSLHDALPISYMQHPYWAADLAIVARTAAELGSIAETMRKKARQLAPDAPRSEEHTSELQSQSNLVCRLLLEKKKQEQAQIRYHLVRYNNAPN